MRSQEIVTASSGSAPVASQEGDAPQQVQPLTQNSRNPVRKHRVPVTVPGDSTAVGKTVEVSLPAEPWGAA